MYHPPPAKMSHLSERIKVARKNAKLTQTQLGAACGVTAQAVHGWEKGEFAPNHVALRTIAEVTATSLEWLISGKSASDTSTSDVHSSMLWVGRVVPSLDWHQIIRFIDNDIAPDATARSHFLCGPRSFQTVVIDRSNEPHINQGDSVIIDPDLAPVPGDTILVKHGDELYLRRFRPRDDHVELVPINPDWPTLKLAPEDANVIGVVAETSRPRRI